MECTDNTGKICQTKRYRKGPNARTLDEFVVAEKVAEIKGYTPNRGDVETVGTVVPEISTKVPAEIPTTVQKIEQLILNEPETVRVNNLQFSARIQKFPSVDFKSAVEWEKHWDSNGTLHSSCSLLIKHIGIAQVQEARGKKKSSLIIRFPEVFMPADNLVVKSQYFQWCAQNTANLVSKMMGYKLGLVTPIAETEYAFREFSLDQFPTPGGVPIHSDDGSWWIDESPGFKRKEWETRSIELAEIRGNMPGEIKNLKERVDYVEDEKTTIQQRLDVMDKKMDKLIENDDRLVSSMEKMTTVVENALAPKQIQTPEQSQQPGMEIKDDGGYIR